MNRLRELRRAKGLTSKQLGEILGLSDSSVRFIERGERGFSMESLKKACDYFGVSSDYLLGATPMQMLDDFVASLERSFLVPYADAKGDITMGYKAATPWEAITKMEIIRLLHGIKEKINLVEIYDYVNQKAAKEDFGE